MLYLSNIEISKKVFAFLQLNKLHFYIRKYLFMHFHLEELLIPSLNKYGMELFINSKFLIKLT